MGCSFSRHQISPDENVPAATEARLGLPPRPQEQLEGPAPAAVVPLPSQLRLWKVTDGGAGPQQGDTVWIDGRAWTVQYVNSKGLLDLRNSAGDVQYGVDSAMVAAAAPAATAAPASAAPAPASVVPAPAEAPPLIGSLGEPCGSKGGSGALVYRCRGGVAGDEECAVKLLCKKTARADQVEALEAEAQLCAPLRHERIVRFVATACDATIPGVDGACVAIVMELLPASLEGLIAARAAAAPRRPFSATRLLGIGWQLAEGLAHLHGLSPPLLHRDVKARRHRTLHRVAPTATPAPTPRPRPHRARAAAAQPANLFLPAGSLERDADEEDEAWLPALRLGDFDMGRRAAEPVSEFVGTPSTMPPEMFAFEPHHTPADVWAVGMTLQWCLRLDDVFAETDMPQLEAAVSTSPPAIPLFAPPYPWSEALEPVADVARRCCATDPAARPAIAEICEALKDKKLSAAETG